MSAALAHGLDSLLRAHQADQRPLPAAPVHSRYTRDTIVAAIRRWHELHGEPPKVFDWDPAWARRRGEDWRAARFEAGDWPSIAMVRRQFGNLSKAVFAAGLRPRRGPARGRSHALSDEQLLDAIRRWADLYGEPPATTDWAPARARAAGQLWRLDRYYAGDWPSAQTVRRRFGTLSNAIRQAGLEPRAVGQHTTCPATIEPGARQAIQYHLNTPGRRCGPDQLAARVRAVAEARRVSDLSSMQTALIELAAAAISWADLIEQRR